MEQVAYALPGAVATYTAKSALFTAGLADRGSFFDCTGSFTVSLSAAATLGAGWSCWIRNVSGTQTIDPNAAELINGSATYAVANAGDTVLIECTGTAFVVSHAQRPSTVAISGGTINGTAIGGSTPAAGAFTTVSATGVITSTLATGTAPFTVASTTVVGNLNVSQLLGATWAAPGTIGSGTPSTGAFTTVSASGQITSTLVTGTAPLVIASTTVVANLNVSQLLGNTWAAPGAIGGTTPGSAAHTTISATGVITSTLVTGTAPFTVASTTVVANLNVSQLLGNTWAAPGAIGGTTPGSAAHTTLTANAATTLTVTTQSTSATTGALIVSGGVGIAKDLFVAGNTWFVPAGVTANLFLLNSTTGYSTAGDHGFNLQMSGVNMAFNNLEAGYISYFTSGTERMRIGSDGNLSLFAAGGSFGGGVLVTYIHNASTAPTTAPSSGGVLYAQAGALKWIGSSGTITQLAAA